VARRKGTRRKARRHGLAGLTVLGAAVVAGVVAGWGIGPVEPAEISPADVVSLRFPADWDEPTGSTPTTPAIPAGAYALASADSQPVADSRLIDTEFAFSPHRTLVPGTTGWAPMRFADAQPHVAPTAPRTAPAPEPAARPAPAAAARPEAQPEIRTATAVTRAAPPPPAPHVRKDSGVMFSDAQLATIKHRLKLSGYQEQYWPPVASALHDIGLRVSHDAGHGGTARGAQARLAQIDPDGPEVARLKSAAFPLIMSMNEDQKREVRTIAHVMGLHSVAASF